MENNYCEFGKYCSGLEKTRCLIEPKECEYRNPEECYLYITTKTQRKTPKEGDLEKNL